MAEVVDRNQLERPSDADPGVVDQPGEPAGTRIGHRLDGGGNLLRLGDVKGQWPDPLGAGVPQSLGIGVLADTGEHREPEPVEVQHARPADPGRAPGDEDGARSIRHVPSISLGAETALCFLYGNKPQFRRRVPSLGAPFFRT